MKRKVEDWSVEDLHKARSRISFPEYQREPNLWSVEKKRLLIDSILEDLDIPKLYFNETEDKGIEVVDGTQRLWTLWQFLDEDLEYKQGGKLKTFSRLSAAEQRRIRTYTLQVAVFKDASDTYLRMLFVRLQLGLLLVTGERLNAATGRMKEFVFSELSSHKFIRGLKIPKRRRAKETLGAQIAINWFARAKQKEFARTRYEDLRFFFQEYEHPEGADLAFFRKQTKDILATLDEMWGAFGSRVSELRNRSYILSIVLAFGEIGPSLGTEKAKREFVSFVFDLWGRLRQEISAGIDRKNKELYAFETMLSSAPGERYQIERRHEKVLSYFEHYRSIGGILGDKGRPSVRKGRNG